MVGNRINSQALFYASVLLLAIELLAVAGISQTGVQPLLVLGIARIAESAFLLLMIQRWCGGLDALGLTGNSILEGLKRGFFWSAIFGVVSVVVLGALYVLDFNVLQQLSAPVPASISGVLLLLLVGGLLSPIAEEVFFRGIVFGFLRKWGILPAILGSTILFSLVHALITGVSFVQVIGGLVFAIAYEAEKNLMVPATIHVLGNMALFILSSVLAL